MLLAVGCARWHSGGKFELPPLQGAPGSVAMEIRFVEFPFGQPDLNAPLWAQIDEQQLPPEVRKRLDANGFRAGVVGGQIPAALERRLAPQEEAQEAPADPNEVDVRKKPAVWGSFKQWRLGDPFKVIVAGEKERLPQLTVLIRDDEGEVQGETFKQVQGYFEGKAFAEPDGRVRLELVPQVEHGEAQPQYAHSRDGIYQVEYSPPHEIYQALAFAAKLLPGQTLVLGGVLDRPGSLGYQYFTEEFSGRLTQKLILIRLVGGATPDAAALPTEAAVAD
ncbi:MAG TPA: hypothetical protein VMV10_28985 [Pirellulales bacterium]|nr:hypothetical protein [Pirellulales bacterium]